MKLKSFCTTKGKEERKKKKVKGSRGREDGGAEKEGNLKCLETH